MKKHLMAVAALGAALLAPNVASAQGPADEADVSHSIKGNVVAVDAAAGTVQVSLERPRGGRGGQGGGDRPCNRGENGESGQQGEPGQSGPSGESGPSGRQGPPQGVASKRGGKAKTVTVKTDASTRIRRAGANATLADIKVGDKVKVVIITEEDTTLTEALNTPAKVISAKAGKSAPTTPTAPTTPDYQLPTT